MQQLEKFFTDFYEHVAKAFYQEHRILKAGCYSVPRYFDDVRKYLGTQRTTLDVHRQQFREFSQLAEPDVVYASAFYWTNKHGTVFHVLELTPDEVLWRIEWFHRQMELKQRDNLVRELMFAATQPPGPTIPSGYRPPVTFPLIYWAMSVEVKARAEHAREEAQAEHEKQLARIAHEHE